MSEVADGLSTSFNLNDLERRNNAYFAYFRRIR